MMAKNPLLFSIVMPAFNAADTVAKSIGSVFDQYYENWELIVINDGSNDGTERIVRDMSQNEPRVSVIDTENHGVSAARNRGLREARGDWALFLDADDTISPYCFVRANDFIERVPDVDVVHCRWGYVAGGSDISEFVDQPPGGLLFPGLANSIPFLNS